MNELFILDYYFIVISSNENIFSKNAYGMLRNESPSLDFYMKLLRRDTDAFAKFIDILIETIQNDIVTVLLTTCVYAFNHYLDCHFARQQEISRTSCIKKFCDVTQLLLLLEYIHL